MARPIGKLYTVTFDDFRAPTNNKTLGSHWAKRQAPIVRAAFAALPFKHAPGQGRTIPPQFIEPVVVMVEHRYKSQLPDTDAVSLAQKWALDGLRDAGVIPDDTPRWVRAVIFGPSMQHPRPSLSLTLETVESWLERLGTHELARALGI